ncbi:MAG: dihydropteroate synthase, partial [Planctomycetota bacterium]
MLDIGGESTRPGAEPVALEDELARVLPVVEALAPRGALSIDTTKARVAAAALAAGARVVNDVSAARLEPEILALVAAHGAGLILMHMRGTPRDMQREPHYDDVVREVTAHLRARAAAAWQAGVALERIALDPGLGFGKDLNHNLALLRALPELTSLGFPLVVGLSRKRFLGALTGEERPERREHATTAGVALAHARGAAWHRVHDVCAARAALAVAAALEGGV